MIAQARTAAKQVWLWHARRTDRRRRSQLGMEEHNLPPEMWDATVDSAGHLVIGGCDVTEVADRYGTPLYLVDKGRLEKNYTTFLESFRRHYSKVEVDYSYKTNPLPGVLSTLHEFGAGAEVISPFELWLALKLGVPPARVTFNGPAKTVEGLRTAVNSGIRMINLDSFYEIEHIDRFAGDAGRTQRVGVRVTTSVGWSSQFGLPIRLPLIMRSTQVL